jgi:hypothetical protein
VQIVQQRLPTFLDSPQNKPKSRNTL